MYMYIYHVYMYFFCYRGFDFGNHFCEWCYDYSHDEPPYYKACIEDFPSRDKQVCAHTL